MLGSTTARPRRSTVTDAPTPSASRALASAAAGWVASCVAACAFEGARAVLVRQVGASGRADSGCLECR
jgi:hypothetical protein